MWCIAYDYDESLPTEKLFVEAGKKTFHCFSELVLKWEL